MKINLFCWGDSSDINTWSNVPYFFTRALASRNVEIRRFNLIPQPGLIYRLLIFLNRIRNRAVSLLGLRRRIIFRIPAIHRLVNFHLTRTCQEFQDADLNLFLTFSFSSNRYSDVPVALYCDRTYEHHLEEEGIRPGFSDRWFIRREKRNLRNARYVFSFNQACLEFIRDRYGIQSVVLLRAGVNFASDPFPDPGALIARKEAERNILFVGRVFHQRGVDVLLDAFRRFNQQRPQLFTLHLVGINDDELPEPLPHVICHGYLRKDDPAQYVEYIDLLASARLFVMPTRPGPVPGVLREALWMCTPVILTNVPDAENRVQNGKNGILTARADPQEIANAMSTLTANLALWRQMASYARESVRNETWDSTADQFLHVIGRVDS